MADASPTAPNDPEGIKRRRDTRNEIVGGTSVALSIITVLGTALGFSPLTKIWTALPLLLAFALIVFWFWSHHNQKSLFQVFPAAGSPSIGKLPRALSVRHRILERAAVILLIFGAGAWVGSSGRNAYLLAAYGTLGDLAISPGNDMVTPAAIQLRKDGGLLCFYTTATFNVRNARSDDVQIGLISNSLSLADDTNSPLYPAHPSNDVTQTGGNISGVRLITGSVNDWAKTIDSIKEHLTTLRRGESKDITIVQNRFYNETCLADPAGKVAQNYQGPVVKISGELVMVLPDGTWRQESFGLTEPAKVTK